MKTTRKMLYIRKSVMIGLCCIFSLLSLTGVCHAAQADSEYTRLTYQGITKVANEKKGIRVTWPKTTLGSGYKIYRKTGTGSWVLIKTITNKSTLSYVDTSAVNGKYYTYTVRAYLGIIQSNYNKTGLSIYRLRTPYGISKCVSNNPGEISLTWDKNGSASGYQIALSANSSFSTVSKKKVTSNSVVIKNLIPGRRYYIKVQAYKKYKNKNYFSGFCGVKSVVTATQTIPNTSGRIYTVDDLININKNLSGTYTLMNNLNLSGRAWVPIGTSKTPFKGKFNGNGYTISNLTITGSADNQGLFGVTDGAEITNIRVTGSVSGHTYVGGIVGIGYNTTLSYCINKAAISGVNQVGGVIGRVHKSKVSYCMNEGVVKGTTRGVGGISADIYPSGSISYCLNTGMVTGGTDLTGGIVGGCTEGPVTYCINTAPVGSKGGRTGAIAGDNASYAGLRTGNYFLKTGSVNASYKVIGTNGGTFTSTSYSGVVSLRNNILSRFR